MADSMTFGQLTFNIGFRLDRYNGLVSKFGPQRAPVWRIT